MEVVDYWKAFKAPKNLQYYRESKEVLKVPLYEVKQYKEYNEGAKRALAFYDKARDALEYHPEGYTQKSQKLLGQLVDLDGVITATFNIRALYQYYTYEIQTNKLINSYSNIVEIGAGVGDFCRLIYNMGFTGSYTIVDLEETNKIQKYALGDLAIKYLQDVPELEPNTLVISTWGLSETPIKTRPTNLRDYEGGLFAYQQSIFEQDNKEYFGSLEGVNRMPMDWLPWDGSSIFMTW